ncbi:ferritin-like domain-containing protein [Sorangium sp. So ce1151]|uniref:ferritin-like domain-containing protein n=1 Tax=Sorangium sp. So ce1151 TaxID=3133332 RepID=UPI003F6411A9
MEVPVLGSLPPPIKNRPLDMLSTDTAALRAIAQAAVSVELFTIPLYMATMYSIQGTHQINSKGVKYYKGRQWPGLSTSASPQDANAKAFNIIFSVFIQEMLHLQMAANLATALGARPSFTGTALQTPENGWICYGRTLSTIPHIVDLKDTSSYKSVRVNLEELNHNQCELFLAIEQPEKQAREELISAARNKGKYFPEVPLAGWTPQKTDADLPLFGTIGYMYECYAQYISIEYTDGQTLWEKLFDNAATQKDMFNLHGEKENPGHPKKEYPQFDTLFESDDMDSGQIRSFNKAIDMMCAITDQGEGSSAGIDRYRRTDLLMAVQEKYREDKEALEAAYPSFSNDGGEAASRDTEARFHSAGDDHYERFGEVKKMLGSVYTWKQWHADGKRWTRDMLINDLYDPETAPRNIPKPEDVAGALNRLKDGGPQAYATMSTVSNGAIYGITSVLDTYWQDKETQFPYPSMVGSGDRTAICWAIFGQAPDLSQGVPRPQKDRLYHACQGLNLDDRNADHAPGACAAVAIYHSCRGSNGCHAQGGCGFAQLDSGGSSCSSSCGRTVATARTDAGGTNLCSGPKPEAGIYSAPSDNKCRTFGGCAVPISASQLFPNAERREMKLYDFGPAPEHNALPLPGTLSFQLGDSVYEKAWEAYSAVMKARGHDAGAAPAPTDLRLALPPST